MTRTEFMKELARLLQDIPAEEREAALDYYDGYFEDAGPEAEKQVLRELGSPAQVAAIVKGMGREDGAFTERGFTYEEPGREKENEVMKRAAKKEQTGRDTQQTNNARAASAAQPVKRANGWRIAFFVLLAILTFPLWIGAAAVVFGAAIALLVGAAGLLFGLTVGVGALTIALLASGAGLLAGGVGTFLVSPLLGFLLFGAGLLVLGLGILALCLAVLVVGKLLPMCVRWFVNLCSWPFRKGKVAA